MKWSMFCLAGVAVLGAAQDWNPLPPKRTGPLAVPTAAYWEAIERTAAMANDQRARQMVQDQGLALLNLTWEDTGRYKNSAVGPNISDMTIQVGFTHPDSRAATVRAMPVIRYPNFSDRTTDLDPRDFTLMVGNHRGGGLQRVSLYDFLANPSRFMSSPRSWPAQKRTLLAPRDQDGVLVSAQACFLPIPGSGKATFNPVVFNYQSSPGNPAVLTLLATREGTSMTVIDNQRDAFAAGSIWGQRLFHNLNGRRTSLTGQRESAWRQTDEGRAHQGGNQPESGLNMVLLVQVPLKQREPEPRPLPAFSAQAGASGAKAEKRLGIENAVIGHGDVEGPFTETDGLAVERDPRFPVRVTVQFYKATADGHILPEDVRQIKQQLDRVYDLGATAGSLVTDGDTGRPTEYVGCKVQPRSWWTDFWTRYERSTGTSRAVAVVRLRRLLGSGYEAKPVSDLYLRDLLR